MGCLVPKLKRKQTNQGMKMKSRNLKRRCLHKSIFLINEIVLTFAKFAKNWFEYFCIAPKLQN